MAEQRSTGSLADGAERLERLIRGVKDRQFSEVRTAPEPKSVSNAFAVSPEETWSKKYMTAGIGPHEFKPVQMPAAPAAILTAAPLKPAPMTLEPAMEVQAPRPTPKTPEPAVQAKASPKPATPRSAGDLRPSPIGQTIAKPQRKRSWFGRLVKD